MGCDTETTDTQPRAAQLEPRFDPGVQVDAPAVEPVFGSLDERLAALQPVKTRAEALRYLNRLSDWLFVVARAAALRFGYDEVLWDQERT